MLRFIIKVIWVAWVTLVCLQACQHFRMPHGGVAYASDIEATIGAGYGFPLDKSGWKATDSTIEITVGKRVSERFFIGLEMDLSHLSFINRDNKPKQTYDSTAIAFSPILKYDFIRFKDMKFYGMVGAGIGFVNGSPSNNIIGHNPQGQIKAGFGFEFKFTENTTFSVGAKYNHLSSHNAGDRGINTGGISMGFTWRF